MYRYSLAHGRVKEALTWADELFISGCLAEANQVLFEVWIFFRGISDCAWLVKWYSSQHDHHSLLESTTLLCWSIEDGIDMRVLMETIFSGPTKVKKTSKTPCAMRTKVINILGSLGTLSPGTTKAVGALWRLICREDTCVTKVKKSRAVTMEDIQLGVEILPIYPLHIYGLSARGQMPETETTLGEIRQNMVGLLRAQGTHYWENELLGYDSEDDDSIENFYEQYFPKDIPDEWSLQKQMITHGAGSLFGTEKVPSVVKLLRKLFGNAVSFFDDSGQRPVSSKNDSGQRPVPSENDSGQRPVPSENDSDSGQRADNKSIDQICSVFANKNIQPGMRTLFDIVTLV